MFAVKSSTAVFQVRWRPMSRTTSPARIRSCPLKTTTASRRTLSVGTMSLRTVWSAHRIPPKASRRPDTAGRDFLHSSSITWEKLTSHSSRRTPGRSALTRDTSDLVVGSGFYCFCFSIIEMANRKVLTAVNITAYLHSAHLFTDRSYLSLDWEPEIKKKYFDETVVEVKLMSGAATLSVFTV